MICVPARIAPTPIGVSIRKGSSRRWRPRPTCSSSRPRSSNGSRRPTPTPPLLPAGGQGRAIVRAMAAVIGCDIHPVNNMRILSRLRTDLDAGDADVAAWIAQWIGDGFGALEAMIAGYGGLYAFGDSPTIADCYLLPQRYSAERFRVDLTAFPHIRAAADRFAALAPVADAHPDRQPDADAA